MHKKIAFTAVGLTLFAAPFIASAQAFTIPQLPPNPTISDLQNEIQQLTQIVTQLISTRSRFTPPIGGFTASSTPPTHTTCTSYTPTYDKTQIGGGDPCLYYVSPPPTQLTGPTSTCPLRSMLVDCPSGSNPAYTTIYDSNNCPIQSLSCASNATSSPTNFTASPTSGPAPLTVTFSSSQGAPINFGDGQSGTIPPTQCAQTSTIGSSPICNQGTVTHTYASAGSYNATLGTNAGYTCPVVDTTSFASVLSNWSCRWQSGQVFGSQTITVTGSATSTPSLTWGPTPVPIACPVYTFPLCPPGQQNQAGPVTTDANGCQVPHNTCVPATTTPTCSYGGVSTAIQGGSSACSNWCLSQQTGSGAVGRVGGFAPPSQLGGSSCVYMDSTGASQTISSAPAQSANVANALVALESALQSFLSGAGN